VDGKPQQRLTAQNQKKHLKPDDFLKTVKVIHEKQYLKK
jgi:hypothetical protein